MQSQSASSLWHGCAQGVELLEDAISSSAAGLVRKPLAGARRRGMRGAVVGAGKGVVGALSKPVAAAFFFVAKATEGLSKT